MTPLGPDSTEEHRSTLLRMMNILDAQPIEEMEHITRIAQSFFQVSNIVISLLDTKRQWFLPRQTPPRSEAPLIANDSHEDAHFYNDPTVTDEKHIQFHACYPLCSVHGISLGTLCLYHNKPRAFTTTQLEQLGALAYMIQTCLQKMEIEAESAITHDMLRKTNYINTQIFSRSAIGLVLMSLDKRPLKVNPAICTMLGYSEKQLLNTAMKDITFQDDLSISNALYDQILRDDEHHGVIQKRYITADGSLLWAMVSISMLYNPDGSQYGLLLAISDISEQKDAESALITLSHDLEQHVEQRTQELQRSHNFIQDITDHIPAMISCISPDNTFTFANRHLRSLLGYSDNSFYHLDIRGIIHPDIVNLFIRKLEESRQQHKPIFFDHSIDTPPKNKITLHTEMVPAKSPEDGTYVLSTDITKLTSLRDQLEFEANHDHLTGLPNRRAIIAYLTHLAGKQRHRGLALLFFDIDNLKYYNDHYDHDFGDRVIKAFARILRKHTRSDDLIGRLSGDEFVMIVHEKKNLIKEVDAISRKLKFYIERPILIKGETLSLSASMGNTLLSKDVKLDVSEFIRQADAAMYQVKRNRSRKA